MDKTTAGKMRAGEFQPDTPHPARCKTPAPSRATVVEMGSEEENDEDRTLGSDEYDDDSETVDPFDLFFEAHMGQIEKILSANLRMLAKNTGYEAHELTHELLQTFGEFVYLELMIT
jgi:hypothetical protein